jgi:hypothetical protein
VSLETVNTASKCWGQMYWDGQDWCSTCRTQLYFLLQSRISAESFCYLQSPVEHVLPNTFRYLWTLLELPQPDEPKSIENVRIWISILAPHYVFYHYWKSLLNILLIFKPSLDIFKVVLSGTTRCCLNHFNKQNPGPLKVLQSSYFSWCCAIFSTTTENPCKDQLLWFVYAVSYLLYRSRGGSDVERA